jgi:predicted transcriptional regulator
MNTTYKKLKKNTNNFKENGLKRRCKKNKQNGVTFSEKGAEKPKKSRK